MPGSGRGVNLANRSVFLRRSNKYVAFATPENPRTNIKHVNMTNFFFTIASYNPQRKKAARNLLNCMMKAE